MDPRVSSSSTFQKFWFRFYFCFSPFPLLAKLKSLSLDLGSLRNMQRREEHAYLIGLAYLCVSIKWEFLSFLGLLVKITRWRTWIKITCWTKMTQSSDAWEEMLQPWFLDMHSGICSKGAVDVTSLFWASSCRLMGTSWKIMRIFSCPLGAVWRGVCTDRGSPGWLQLRRNHRASVHHRKRSRLPETLFKLKL